VTTPWTQSATIDLIQSTDCLKELQLNTACQLSYKQERGESGGVGMQQQTINYFGGAQGVQTDKFNVYRNSAALIAPLIDSIYVDNIKYPGSPIVDNVKPVITVRFTQAVNSNTINNQTFYLSSESDTTTHVAGSIVFRESGVITFTPTDDLIRGEKYLFTLKTGQIGNSAGKVNSDPNKTEEVKFTILKSEITISQNSASNIMMGDSFKFSASIDAGSSSVTAKFDNPLYGAVITSESAPCDLNETKGIKSCNFTAIITQYPSWDSSFDNSLNIGYQITVSATNYARITPNSLSFSMNTPTVYLAATGQTESIPINATEGMDGAVQAGIAIDYQGRFERGTGVAADCITDNLTGLMWVRDLDSINNGQPTNWQGALNLIDNTNKGNGYCGYKDWHLPTINELSSLVNYSQSSLALWLKGQGFDNVNNWQYLTSTSSAPTPGNAWFCNFSNGYCGGNKKADYSYLVWPVRRTSSANVPVKIPVTGETGSSTPGSESGVAWPNPRFIVGSGATESCVSDKLTGLMWVRDLNTVIVKDSNNGESTTWYNALASVKQANTSGGYCGYTDWRLPNVTELRSLINYSQSIPSSWLNAQYFESVQALVYWSSSSDASLTAPSAWGIFFYNGRLDEASKSNNNYVWPVRGGRQP
jgi:hypothetical protein